VRTTGHWQPAASAGPLHELCSRNPSLTLCPAVISPADGLPARALRVDPSTLPPTTVAAVAMADALWREIGLAHRTE
jgi:hypothetical protein